MCVLQGVRHIQGLSFLEQLREAGIIPFYKRENQSSES